MDWNGLELVCPDQKCKSGDIKILDSNKIFITVKCEKCGKISDMIPYIEQKKPQKLPKGVSFVKFIEDSD